MKTKLNFVPILIILLIAAFVRLYRIADFTQFRGDQGVAGVVIYEALKNKQIPLTGPTVSTGELPGPAYYYLIALPLILSNFNPLVPAIMFAILGIMTVYMLYAVARRIFGEGPALVVAGLRAFSPIPVEADRTMWNPTAIPFFVILLIFSLSTLHDKKKPMYLLLASFFLGILVQLHYTNALWIPIVVIFWGYEVLVSEGVFKIRKFLSWGIPAIVAFLVPLSPFLYYEATHGFADIGGVISLVFHPISYTETPRFFIRLQNVIAETFMRQFVILDGRTLMIIAAFVIVLPFLFRRNFWSRVFSAIVAFFIIILSVYKGAIFNHYLKFFTMASFLLVGGCLEIMFPKKWGTYIAVLVVAIIAFLYIPKLKLTEPKVGDLQRIHAVVNVILAKSAQEPFSFGLISSESYSDYQYRFFFTLRHKLPLPVTDSSYKNLYLVCEGKCPPSPYLDVHGMHQISVICYDIHCRGNYPIIDLTKFHLIHSYRIAAATIYAYERI